MDGVQAIEELEKNADKSWRRGSVPKQRFHRMMVIIKRIKERAAVLGGEEGAVEELEHVRKENKWELNQLVNKLNKNEL